MFVCVLWLCKGLVYDGFCCVYPKQSSTHTHTTSPKWMELFKPISFKAVLKSHKKKKNFLSLCNVTKKVNRLSTGYPSCQSQNHIERSHLAPINKWNTLQLKYTFSCQNNCFYESIWNITILKKLPSTFLPILLLSTAYLLVGSMF